MIEKLSKNNLKHIVKLANKLWPEDAYEELYDDFEEKIDSDTNDCFLFKTDDDEYIGFIELDIRNDYVEGSNSSPVAYIEGIFIEEEYRRKGIAKSLIDFACDWGKERGCSEIASDCELENELSIIFHKGSGFEEANRLVCFIKQL